MYDAYGADTFRVYEMSMGPLDQSAPWETRAVVGVAPVPAAAVAHRGRRGDRRGDGGRRTGWTLDDATRLLHRTIDGVRDDYDATCAFNTAIAKLIELTNHADQAGRRCRARRVEPLVLMVAPVAPHIAEELW